MLETYLRSGLVPRLPTFLASVVSLVLAVLSLACGLILDTVTRGRIEAKRIAYLALPAFVQRGTTEPGQPTIGRSTAGPP